MSELVIDDTNFKDHFFDVRRHGPKTGQIMAKFTAHAVFGDGPQKVDVVKLLQTDKVKAATQVMRKIHCAAEPDNIKICRQMCEDLASGMSFEDVVKKEYEFLVEAFYYTQRENVPQNDPHWTTIELIDASKISIDEETGEIKCRIEL